MTGMRCQSIVTRVAAGLMLGALLVAFGAPPHAPAQPMHDCSPASVSSGAGSCHHTTPQTCDRMPGCAGLTMALRPAILTLPQAAPARFDAPDRQVSPIARLRTGPPTPPPNS